MSNQAAFLVNAAKQAASVADFLNLFGVEITSVMAIKLDPYSEQASTHAIVDITPCAVSEARIMDVFGHFSTREEAGSGHKECTCVFQGVVIRWIRPANGYTS